MAKVLLVTNDFPPTVGGIQSYLRDFVDQLDPSDVVVFASTQDEEAAREYDASVPYTVVRWPRKMMLPTPSTARKMVQLIKAYGMEVVWFGAAAPVAWWPRRMDMKLAGRCFLVPGNVCVALVTPAMW